MSRILIFKAGTLAPYSTDFTCRFGDTEDTFIAAAGLAPDEVEVIDLYRDQPLPEIGAHAGVMITGAAAMVTEQAPWMLRGAAWLRAAVAADQPVLGICFGHQLLAHALGGTVGPNPTGLEAGTLPITLAPDPQDPLFGPVATGTRFQEHHYQTVLTPPPGSSVIGHSAQDAHQVLRHGPHAWGVQFHPELTGEMMRLLMDGMRADHAAAGVDPSDLDAGLADTPEGPALLQRFVALARG
ncbi:glutamine amidotransferase [Gemmobacter serpentinus]|uniref:glutamine amidotransferase n=1 Tax=Gemmobacter serpentinus TaxID=2652247 RepID=UPI00124C27B7|nr:glutamine amidotransferase [Gemmobacter serpentinus]